tara:strand:+ start:518 stop:934 length:417 start_codon:yes stop_codon:yes gene_type:complete
MKFKTHNDSGLTTGISLQGHIFNSYEGLKKIFGPPIISERDDKIECQWIIELDNGDIASIYSWKEPYDKCYKWHVGGHKKRVIYTVDDIIEEAESINKKLGFLCNECDIYKKKDNFHHSEIKREYKRCNQCHDLLDNI